MLDFILSHIRPENIGIAAGLAWAGFWLIVAAISHRSDLKQVELRMRR